ncbi:MAG: M48 family metallopeptidase [Candidatus Omnitrophica bacterium]|nr:M48 family metallopeptidase [Candidatus Omnitrophota bacterium]MBU0896008.1 M48 family metallopeptidase [Candidatus Omnitrophota bacterium]MBU1367411.1 M48 family metallopeptidase [Candidatus Omnitrophota bacterium]MBU1524622.1 M48 family metallopeptidase [Candidatus Omnitrophota bacterium]MBU1811002.1 M48 family metallopeptidase [Candidatus Omnitrophota bacterium]
MVSQNLEIERVEIIKNLRRRRTISAKVVGGVMRVSAPGNISQEKLSGIINKFKQRFKNKKVKQELNQNEDLPAQAEKLNQRYFSGKLNIVSIEYVTSQNGRFGCCNYKNKTIRISHRLAQMPGWVKDYVIVHELAHLIEPNHSKSFWDIVSRYKLAERAKGFLIATQQGVLLD